MVLKSALCREAPGGVGAMSRERNQHRPLWTMLAPQIQRDLQAAAIRHDDVQQNGIRAKLLDETGYFGAGGSQSHVNRFATQKDTECHHGIPVVVCDQDAERALIGHSPSG